MANTGAGYSRKPPPIPLAMSAADNLTDRPVATPAATQAEQHGQPTPSPIPMRPKQDQGKLESTQVLATSPRLEPCRPTPKNWPQPRLRFQCHNTSHKAADILFEFNNPTRLIQNAVDTVLATLYSPSCNISGIPPVKSITLVMREMDGVAYTTGNNDLGDDNHKEIHFNLNHIMNSGPNKARMVSEIRGVMVHEMVHCWQWNGQGHAPGGLIEGMADFVRLKAGLAPPHWKEVPGKWDAGYERTAYFLNWLEGLYGDDAIITLNGALQKRKYEESLWVDIFGEKVEKLYDEYKKTLRAE